MTKEQKKAIERKLAGLKRRFVTELLSRLSQCTATASEEPTELLDVVADSENDELTARVAEADAEKISQIEDALEMLRRGKYGVCENCGKPIRKRRLKAIPFATLCIRCKEAQESLARGEVGVVPAAHSEDSPVQFSLDEKEDTGEQMEDLYREMESKSFF